MTQGQPILPKVFACQKIVLLDFKGKIEIMSTQSLWWEVCT